MIFPETPTKAHAETAKSMNYHARTWACMDGSSAPAALRRLDSMTRCDVQGCYDMAVWLISFNGKDYRWCTKHTRKKMREAQRWRHGPSDFDFISPKKKSPEVA